MKPLALILTFILALISIALLNGAGTADQPETDKNAPALPVLVFATVEQASRQLSKEDEFVSRLSPFDRAARLKSGSPVSQSQYLEFVNKQVLPWTDAQKTGIRDAWQTLLPRLSALPLKWPGEIFLITTSGAEEANAAYTRGRSIILPASQLKKGKAHLAKLLAHELFHILSRTNPKLRRQLYQTIGFQYCGEITFPDPLQARKITNPDAPRNDYYIKVKLNEQTVTAIPVLFADPPEYDVKRGGQFFNYLQFRLLIVELDAETGSAKPAMKDGRPHLVLLSQISGYFEQVGRNTNYVIHPEEILADHFALLLIGQTNLRSPKIMARIRQVLIDGRAKP